MQNFYLGTKRPKFKNYIHTEAIAKSTNITLGKKNYLWYLGFKHSVL